MGIALPAAEDDQDLAGKADVMHGAFGERAMLKSLLPYFMNIGNKKL